MNSFTILSEMSWFTNPTTQERQRGLFIRQSIPAYYHQNYTTFGAEGNPDCINHLKNQFGSANTETLQKGINEMVKILQEDLPKIKNLHNNVNLTVCVIPRAKAENTYSQNQKLFRQVVSAVVEKLNGFLNGTTYIIRHTNTRTTHMNRSGYGGDGDNLYI